MQAPPLSVYSNILNQARALEQAFQYQSGPGQLALELAAETIQSAREIVLVAVGASYSACFPFLNRLAGAGRQVRLEDAAEFLHYTYRAYDAQAVYILISRSGETIEIVKALKVVRSLGRRIIGVTNEANSSLANQADIALVIGGPSDYLISIQTYLTTLLTLHYLADFVLSPAQTSSLNSSITSLIDAVQETLDRYQAISADWKQRFIPHPAIYILGRGYSLASANQGALLMHEMARIPGLAFSAGAFRHGPWEALDERMHAFVFAPQDATFPLNASLAVDLCALGSSVTLIASQIASEMWVEFQKLHRLEIWDIPAFPAEIAPFLEILPLEFFIYEYACWQGLTPGIFRACTPITLAETGSLATRQ